ncbi:MAG: integrase core domain-containing protein, partial [Paraprevotella sp.]|nr:integrase core domain-containing protein [Paraprevotella sp.]
MEFYSIDDVRKAVKAAVEFYNHERPHMSLDGMTPDEAAMCEGEIRKKWCSYR